MSFKILMVDDEVVICELTKDYLESKGFEVKIVHDGQTGLDEAKSEKPDLIILDVNMPRMNGFQVLNELKKDFHTSLIPVLMLTAEKCEDFQSEGTQYQAEKYLPKPFMPDALFKEIRHLLQPGELS